MAEFKRSSQEDTNSYQGIFKPWSSVWGSKIAGTAPTGMNNLRRTWLYGRREMGDHQEPSVSLQLRDLQAEENSILCSKFSSITQNAYQTRAGQRSSTVPVRDHKGERWAPSCLQERCHRDHTSLLRSFVSGHSPAISSHVHTSHPQVSVWKQR